jgi:hypothetical protein
MILLLLLWSLPSPSLPDFLSQTMPFPADATGHKGGARACLPLRLTEVDVVVTFDLPGGPPPSHLPAVTPAMSAGAGHLGGHGVRRDKVEEGSAA